MIQLKTIGICLSISKHEPKRMAKSFFLGRKEIQFRQSRWILEVVAGKNFPEGNYSARNSGGGSLMIWDGGSSSSEKNLNYNLSVVDKKHQII